MRDPQLAPPRLHLVFAALSFGFLAIFLWVFLREQEAEWRALQARFRGLEATVKNPHQLTEAVAEAIEGPRYPDGASHGSGCTHSSALAAHLAL